MYPYLGMRRKEDVMCYFTMDTRPWDGNMLHRGKWATWDSRFATIILSHNQAKKFHKTTYVTDDFGKYVITKILKLEPDHIYTDIEGLTWDKTMNTTDVWAWGKFHTYERMSQDGYKHSVHLDDDFIIWDSLDKYLQYPSIFQSPEPVTQLRKGAYMNYVLAMKMILDRVPELKNLLPQAWINYSQYPIEQQVARCVSILYIQNKECLYDYAHETINLLKSMPRVVSSFFNTPYLLANEHGIGRQYLDELRSQGCEHHRNNVNINCFPEQWGVSAYMDKHNVKSGHIFNDEKEIRFKRGTGVHHVWGGATDVRYCNRIIAKAKESFPRHFPIKAVKRQDVQRYFNAN